MIRFSREDMLKLWKPSRILNSMIELPDIVSIPPLNPMSFQPLEQDEVNRTQRVSESLCSQYGPR